jgi:hypothetical protein
MHFSLKSPPRAWDVIVEAVVIVDAVFVVIVDAFFGNRE